MVKPKYIKTRKLRGSVEYNIFQCKGITNKGMRCKHQFGVFCDDRYYPTENDLYCGQHYEQYCQAQAINN